jgi:uncharacterized protein YsxB (DUF464 family)
MIKVNFYKQSGEIIGFRISGHANFCESGSDIVCAAVSMLAINTANAIETFTEDTFEVAINEEEGFLNLKMTSTISKESKILLEALCLGLTNVNEEYGSNYIHIQNREV